MAKKLPPHLTTLELTSLSADPHFAMAGDSDFASLTAPLGTLPGGPYDYAYVATNASTPGIIKILADSDLVDLNGIIATGNGKDTVDLSHSNGDNLVFAGNGADTVVGGAGDDIVFGGNGPDNLGGGAGDDQLNGGNGPDKLTGGTDDGTSVVTATEDGVAVSILSGEFTTLANGAELTGTVAATGDVLVEEGIQIDVSTNPDTVLHVFSFAPTDIGPLNGTSSFIVAEYETNGSLVATFNVTMTEGVKNFFTLADDDMPDDGGTLAVFAGGSVVPTTLGGAGAVPLDTDAYQPVTLSVAVTAGDMLNGGLGPDTFVYAAGDGVDVISGYQTVDTILLQGIDPSDVTSITQGGNTTLLFSDGAGGFVADAAIELLGVTNVNQIHLTFA